MAESVVPRAQQILINSIHIPWLLITHFGTYCYRACAFFRTSDKPASSSTAVVGEMTPCRFRLDDGTSAKLRLPNGREIGYAQYGSQSGRAVFYIHGAPGSRIEGANFDAMAVRLGARIIAVDRPGYGWSSPHPERTLVDHARDIETLAKYLEVDEYGVLGMSAGGPFALACAASLPPDKLKTVAIACGFGPPDIGSSGMNFMYWLGYQVGIRYLPGLCRWWVTRGPEARLDLSAEERFELIQQQISKAKIHPKEAETAKDVDLLRLGLKSCQEAYAQGTDGFMQDAKLISTDFGFRIEDVRPDLLVQLWYGKQDTNVPARHGEQIALRIGARTQLRVEDETHSSLISNWREKILEDLVGSM